MNEYNDPIVNAIAAAVSFPVNVGCEGYPDVIFNIIFEKQLVSSMIEKSISALEQYMISYNKIHFLRPIHYVSDADNLPEPSSDYSVFIHVDFGNANPKALIGAVKAV